MISYSSFQLGSPKVDVSYICLFTLLWLFRHIFLLLIFLKNQITMLFAAYIFRCIVYLPSDPLLPFCFFWMETLMYNSLRNGAQYNNLEFRALRWYVCVFETSSLSMCSSLWSSFVHSMNLNAVSHSFVSKRVDFYWMAVLVFLFIAQFFLKTSNGGFFFISNAKTYIFDQRFAEFKIFYYCCLYQRIL